MVQSEFRLVKIKSIRTRWAKRKTLHRVTLVAVTRLEAIGSVGKKLIVEYHTYLVFISLQSAINVSLGDSREDWLGCVIGNTYDKIIMVV